MVAITVLVQPRSLPNCFAFVKINPGVRELQSWGRLVEYRARLFSRTSRWGNGVHITGHVAEIMELKTVRASLGGKDERWTRL